MIVKKILPINNESFEEVKFEDVKNIVINHPLTSYFNRYTSENRGGSNLTIGEIVDCGRTLTMFGGKPESVSIVDTNSNKIYTYEY